MKIEPLGDAALIVRVCDEGSDATEMISAVRSTVGIIRGAKIPAILDLAPSYTSIGVFYDPMRTRQPAHAFESIRDDIEHAMGSNRGTMENTQGKSIEIPVCYDAEFALDLERVEKHTNLTGEEVVRLHAAGQYVVHCIGFMPGFPYLGGLAHELATPRLSTPRTSVPAGAVAIGGSQTGVYPQRAPGGWNIIGRSPLRFFNVDAASPALLMTGDRVRFRSISREDFEQLKSDD